MSLRRILCDSENCSRSFYTYHEDEVSCCPYCRSDHFYDYDSGDNLKYRIDTVDNEGTIVKEGPM